MIHSKIFSNSYMLYHEIIWFLCFIWLLFFFLTWNIISIALAICFYLDSVSRECICMEWVPWERKSKDPWDEWIFQSKGKMLLFGIQHSHGIRAHKKWSISTASRSQFPIQRITQERISELVSASGTAAESSAGRNTIYKSEETVVNTKFFSTFWGKWQNRWALTSPTESIGSEKW
jgi:hypothetical protein